MGHWIFVVEQKANIVPLSEQPWKNFYCAFFSVDIFRSPSKIAYLWTYGNQHNMKHILIAWRTVEYWFYSMDLLFIKECLYGGRARLRNFVSACLHLNLGRMTNTEYILYKLARENVRSCTVWRKFFAWLAGLVLCPRLGWQFPTKKVFHGSRNRRNN
jgi:hypothetical protein